MKNSHTIFLLNCSLAGIALFLLAIGVAWRQQGEEPPAVPPPSEARTQPPAPPKPAPTRSKTSQPNGEIADIKQEIEDIRQEKEDEIQLQKERIATAHANESKWISNEPQPVTFAEIESSPDLYPVEYQFMQNNLTKAAEKRIEARRIILEHLDETNLSDSKKQEIVRYFAEMDEFDSQITVREYKQDEAPNNWQLDDQIVQAFADTPKLSRERLTELLFEGATGKIILPGTSIIPAPQKVE